MAHKVTTVTAIARVETLPRLLQLLIQETILSPGLFGSFVFEGRACMRG